jgi:hypothetical protein
MFKSLIVATIATLSITTASACDIHGNTGIVEDNNLWISADAKTASNVTETDFNQIIDDIAAIYSPIFSSMGKTLEVVRKWNDGTVNAYAQQVGNIWKVSMFGGLARHETITADGFATVMCHEIGHHIGGAPKKVSRWSSSWASNEGQADFFGTMKCLRKYMEKDNNMEIVANMNVPTLVIEKCSANFSTPEDQAMCQRGAMAGLSLGNLFKALRRLTTELKFETPDANVVSRTNDNHPAPQCRLDTYFAGSICARDHYDDVSRTDANMGVCNRVEGDKDGIRPLCWYKPKAI